MNNKKNELFAGKHIIRRMILLFTAAVLCIYSMLALNACKKNVDQGDLLNDNAIAIFYSDLSDPYDASVSEYLKKEFDAKERKYEEFNASGSADTQLEQIRQASDSRIDLMIVNIAGGSSSAADSAISLAKQKNIPIIFFGNNISDDAIASYEKCVYIGSDNDSAARLQGEMIGKYLSENFDSVDLNKDGVINYVLFRTPGGGADKGTYAAVEECNKILAAEDLPALSFYDSENSDMYLTDDTDGTNLFDTAKKLMSSLITGITHDSGNTVELVIAENDDLALGAISALKEGLEDSGNTTMIPVFGIGDTEDAKAAILDGSLTGTVRPDAVNAASVICTVADNYKNGKEKFDSVSSGNIIGKSKVILPYEIYNGD